MSKMAKRLSAACVALVLAVCLVGSTVALTACGGKDEYDFNGFYASATFGVTLLVGQTFTLSNCNVYGMTGDEADSDNDICIAGMRADADYADTVILLDANGNSTDGVQITSASQEVTLQYTGTKYTYPEGADTFTYTISASYATSAEVVTYTVGRDGSPETYAVIGDGADAMSVIVYYDGGSDTHADNTITVKNASGGSTLAEGLNTITATSVCLTSSGTAVTVPAVYLNIEVGTADENGTVVTTYTAYSDAEMATKLYDYSFTEWGADWTEYKFDGTIAGEEGSYLLLDSDGTFWFGDDSTYGYKDYGAGTNGWWGYVDGELTFVKHNGSGEYASSICETSVSGSSVTIGFKNGTGNACIMTIDDIGCLAGNAGYDLSELLVDGEYDTITGVLTSSEG